MCKDCEVVETFPKELCGDERCYALGDDADHYMEYKGRCFWCKAEKHNRDTSERSL